MLFRSGACIPAKLHLHGQSYGSRSLGRLRQCRSILRGGQLVRFPMDAYWRTVRCGFSMTCLSEAVPSSGCHSIDPAAADAQTRSGLAPAPAAHPRTTCIVSHYCKTGKPVPAQTIHIPARAREPHVHCNTLCGAIMTHSSTAAPRPRRAQASPRTLRLHVRFPRLPVQAVMRRRRSACLRLRRKRRVPPWPAILRRQNSLSRTSQGRPSSRRRTPCSRVIGSPEG
jgi:hypothetical protein